jgi:hypothetical protein
VIRIELALLIRGEDPSLGHLAELGFGRAWRAGDQLTTSPGMKHRTGGWEISSQRPLVKPLREQLQAVLDSVEAIWPAIRAAAASGDTVLSVALYVTEGPDLVAIDIGADQMKRLAELGAKLDFDLYQFIPERD